MSFLPAFFVIMTVIIAMLALVISPYWVPQVISHLYYLRVHYFPENEYQRVALVTGRERADQFIDNLYALMKRHAEDGKTGLILGPPGDMPSNYQLWYIRRQLKKQKIKINKDHKNLIVSW